MHITRDQILEAARTRGYDTLTRFLLAGGTGADALVGGLNEFLIGVAPTGPAPEVAHYSKERWQRVVSSYGQILQDVGHNAGHRNIYAFYVSILNELPSSAVARDEHGYIYAITERAENSLSGACDTLLRARRGEPARKQSQSYDDWLVDRYQQARQVVGLAPATLEARGDPLGVWWVVLNTILPQDVPKVTREHWEFLSGPYTSEQAALADIDRVRNTVWGEDRHPERQGSSRVDAPEDAFLAVKVSGSTDIANAPSPTYGRNRQRNPTQRWDEHGHDVAFWQMTQAEYALIALPERVFWGNTDYTAKAAEIERAKAQSARPTFDSGTPARWAVVPSSGTKSHHNDPDRFSVVARRPLSRKERNAAHARLVADALTAGEDVPVSVRVEYPNLMGWGPAAITTPGRADPWTLTLPQFIEAYEEDLRTETLADLGKGSTRDVVATYTYDRPGAAGPNGGRAVFPKGVRKGETVQAAFGPATVTSVSIAKVSKDPATTEQVYDFAKRRHAEWIADALLAGRDVPAHVLAKYPELAPAARAAPPTVTVSTTPERFTADLDALLADYKYRGLNVQAAYNALIKDRGLRPDLDMRDLVKRYPEVRPAPLQRTQTLTFQPTHRDTLINRLVQFTPVPGAPRFDGVWEHGMTGGEFAPLSDRYVPLATSTPTDVENTYARILDHIAAHPGEHPQAPLTRKAMIAAVKHLPYAAERWMMVRWTHEAIPAGEGFRQGEAYGWSTRTSSPGVSLAAFKEVSKLLGGGNRPTYPTEFYFPVRELLEHEGVTGAPDPVPFAAVRGLVVVKNGRGTLSFERLTTTGDVQLQDDAEPLRPAPKLDMEQVQRLLAGGEVRIDRDVFRAR